MSANKGGRFYQPYTGYLINISRGMTGSIVVDRDVKP